jgi:hypothetical protein
MNPETRSANINTCEVRGAGESRANLGKSTHMTPPISVILLTFACEHSRIGDGGKMVPTVACDRCCEQYFPLAIRGLQSAQSTGAQSPVCPRRPEPLVRLIDPCRHRRRNPSLQTQSLLAERIMSRIDSRRPVKLLTA